MRNNSFLPALIALLFFCGCHTTTPTSTQAQSETVPSDLGLFPKTDPSEPIAKYIVEAFEDSKGNLWFGTMAKGVARYDGISLTYFSQEDGLGNNTVASIAEAPNGDLWFGTHEGLVRYDGSTFTRYTAKDGLCHFRVSELLFDKNGLLWIGTWGGVCTFDGTDFQPFDLPKPEVELASYQTTMDWVTDLLEDSEGNIWIGRDGYGASKFDGQSFTHFTKQDGLLSNNVQAIEEDQVGNIWIGCRIAERDHPDPEKRFGAGGLCRYDGEQISQFPEVKGLTEVDVYALYAAPNGAIWIGASGLGLYIYEAGEFTLFNQTDRMDLTSGMGVQGLVQDSKGRNWIGMSGGLFRLKENELVHMGALGPWK